MDKNGSVACVVGLAVSWERYEEPIGMFLETFRNDMKNQ